LKLVGVPLGLLILTLTAIFAFFTMALIGYVISVSHKPIASFDQLAQSAGVPTRVSQFILLFYTLTSCISFIILTCDFVADESGLSGTCGSGCSWLSHRWVVIIILFFTVLYPSSKFRDLSALKAVSIVSIVFMVLMVFIAVQLLVILPKGDKEPKPSTTGLVGVALVVPVHLICFSAHYNAPRLYAELKSRTPKRFTLASGMAIGVAWAIYASFGVVSVLTYPDAKSDILNNYSSDSWRAVCARLFMLVVILTTYPLVLVLP